LTKLYLVSCAQTTLDKEGVFQGSSNHRLSREGIKQTRLLGRYLAAERIDSFYSGPWEGAFHTASILAGRHRRGVIRIKDLQEMDYGKWTGKTAAELKESDPEMLTTWQFEPHKHRMPGGETVGEVQERIVQALEKILSVEKGSGVCVVTHAIPVKTAMCHFMHDDLSLIWLTSRQESTAFNIIDFQNDDAQVIEVVSLKHLSEEVTT
jgi:alpha-ribazole phosphatase